MHELGLTRVRFFALSDPTMSWRVVLTQVSIGRKLIELLARFCIFRILPGYAHNFALNTLVQALGRMTKILFS